MVVKGETWRAVFIQITDTVNKSRARLPRASAENMIENKVDLGAPRPHTPRPPTPHVVVSFPHGTRLAPLQPAAIRPASIG